ncbi:MAG: protein kinase [Deltaproteobacteria bacterium]|nr:protein kinase [Deltaproteobacteria bacterium]
MGEPSRSEDLDLEGSGPVARGAAAGETAGSLRGRVVAGKYRIVGLLGRGGMGVVCRAVVETTGAHVALKLLSVRERAPVAGLEDDAAAVERTREHIARLHREARAAAALDTEHIVQIVDAGTDPEAEEPYLAMELLAGEDLQRLLSRAEVLAPGVAVRILAQTCRGLIKAHAVGIIHRDIKPGNLFLAEGKSGEVVVKILDFGLAKARRRIGEPGDTTELTRTGSILGSPHYMSPEQAQGLKTIDERADIWSLGVVLHKMLTGTTPHPAAESTAQLLVMICTEPPEPVRRRAPWVAEELAEIVRRAVQRRPEDRFATVQQMHDALLGLVGGDVTLTRGDLVGLPEEVRRTGAAPGTLDDELGTVPLMGRPSQWPSPPSIGRAETATVVRSGIRLGRDASATRRWRARWIAVAAAGGAFVLALAFWQLMSARKHAPSPSGSAAPAASEQAAATPPPSPATTRAAGLASARQLAASGLPTGVEPSGATASRPAAPMPGRPTEARPEASRPTPPAGSEAAPVGGPASTARPGPSSRRWRDDLSPADNLE